ncbi:MAG TPA: hypothetical protein VEI73_10935 [Candidatus Acidoferrum sp.]|nr:hypothetical protein [Candidatus Acidoferrum sp.]
MKTRIRVTAAFLAVCAFTNLAKAQNAEFTETMQKNCAGIGVKDGKLSGPGAEMLRPAMAEAQFVLLGEDHGIAQIPDFGAALCAELAPHGFNHLALEIGPYAALELEKFARGAEGAKQFAEFGKQYSGTIAFYNWREEFAMLQQCEKAAPQGMKIWGVDQELMGSTRFLLEKILATNPGQEAKTAIQSLLKENDEDYAAAVKSGSPWDLLMIAGKQEELDHARDLLAKQGNGEAQKLFESLLVSREIYLKNKTADYYNSNRQRALLMKANFVAPFSAEFQQKGAPPKVLFKFGGLHMFRGINPLHSSELGNLAGEFAEAHGFKSTHILILGVKGEQLHFAGIGKPSQPGPMDLTDKDSDFLFLKPLFDAQVAGSWTLYDLRALRTNFSKYGKIDPEFERVIFGYDFIVLIPDPKASHDLE